MKVTFFNGVFARIGGIEAFTNDLALALLADGVDISIVCASLHNPTLKRLKQAGATVHSVPICYGCRWNIPDRVLLPFARWWLRGAEVVIHQKPFDKRAYRNLSGNIKHIYLTAYSPAEQFPDANGAKRFFSYFDGVITQLESFKDELLERGVECPIDVIPLIPPRITAQPVCRKDSRVLRIGMMGRLEPQKNPDYACAILEVFSNTLPEGKDVVEFHVYGEGSLSDRVREKTAQLSFRTKFYGTYQRGDVQRIVSENDGFLITSNSEGQCIVALEILASGRPIFATAVGALPFILRVPERGVLLPQGNAVGAATKIRSWFDQNRWSSPEQIQQSYRKDYDRDHVIGRYVALVRALRGQG